MKSTDSKGFFNRFMGVSRPLPRPELGLDEDIEKALLTTKAYALMSCLQTRHRQGAGLKDIRMLLDKCRQAGWSRLEIDKLEIMDCYYHQSDMAHSAELARRYLQSLRTDPDVLVIAMTSLYHMARFEEAMIALSRARENEQNFSGRVEYYLNAAVILWSNGRVQEAGSYIKNAYQIAEDNIEVLFNAYGIHFENQDQEELDRIGPQILQRCDDDRVVLTLAAANLAQNRYIEGFRLLNSCLSVRNTRHAPLEASRWDGESIAGKTLLLLSEQGLGDTIQMARYLGHVTTKGAAIIVMKTQEETLSLLKFNFPDIHIITRNFDESSISFDYWLNTMSLPYVFQTTAESVPGRAGYLRIPPEVVDYWQNRVEVLASKKRLKIGIAWSGRPQHHANMRRSIPFLSMMDAISPIDALFFALQKQVPPEHPDHLIDLADEIITLADTAALIAEMDLIITVDTSIVHLAGAIGKETWLLLPYRYEWRWGLSGERNNWYESVKVLRQPTHGDWDSVLSDVFGHRFTSHVWSKQERQ